MKWSESQFEAEPCHEHHEGDGQERIRNIHSGKRGAQAIQLAFQEDFRGDRVLAYMAGLADEYPPFAFDSGPEQAALASGEQSQPV